MINRAAVFGMLGVAVAMLLCGCGTLANDFWFTEREGGQRVYGGVRGQWELFQAKTNESSPAEFNDAKWPLLVDLPISAIGDTLSLPYILTVALTRSMNDEQHNNSATKPPSESPTEQAKSSDGQPPPLKAEKP